MALPPAVQSLPLFLPVDTCVPQSEGACPASVQSCLLVLPVGAEGGPVVGFQRWPVPQKSASKRLGAGSAVGMPLRVQAPSWLRGGGKGIPVLLQGSVPRGGKEM